MLQLQNKLPLLQVLIITHRMRTVHKLTTITLLHKMTVVPLEISNDVDILYRRYIHPMFYCGRTPLANDWFDSDCIMHKEP